MKNILFLGLFVIITTFAGQAQTTYYVSSASGNDSYSGKSSSSPWKTISKLNSFSFKPGDRILFKKEDIWREQLIVSSSGTSAARISFSTYGSGNDPVISGADVISGFTQYSGNIWKKSTSLPEQVFFNSGMNRGVKVSSISSVNSAKKWHFSSGNLYVYSTSNPGSSIHRTARRWGVFIKGTYVNIEGLQVEKTEDSGIEITPTATGAIVDNCTVYQWSTSVNTVQGAVTINGDYSEVMNCTIGKKTGNDIADQEWAGFMGIAMNGKNSSVHDNKIYHSAIENETKDGRFATGIRILSAPGITKVFRNYIYHVGGSGIQMVTNTRSGDAIHIYENIVEYPGQAGISLYKTRGEDGVGGKGYVYKNNVSFANRLGGDVGAGGTQASGIHFNDGARSGTQAGKPYIKWFCYENIVHNSQALKVPNSSDAGGISMDYNANYVEVYKNIVHSNYSKGIYMWNSNYCKVYYNIIYGNDAGSTISAIKGGVESAINNQIYNNTYYKNYNGNGKGPNYNAEILFGFNSKNTIIKNNLLYASENGYSYVYNTTNTSGHILDNNIIYSDRSIVARDDQSGEMTFSQWRVKRSAWDKNSKNVNPQLTDPTTGNFAIKSTSPAINAGTLVGLTTDFLGNLLIGLPDIGAMEFGSSASIPIENGGSEIVLNAMDASLTGDAKLGSKSGSKAARVLFFSSLNGEAKFTVNLASQGDWYVWGRLYYASPGIQNSFYIKANKLGRKVLGNDDNEFNQWHWDGYLNKPIKLGTLNAGENTISISAKEPGMTLWVDQIVLTQDINYDPAANLGKDSFAEENNEAEGITNLPTEFELNQNFPNPFNPATTIKYAVPENTHVSLKIFDMLGAEVAELVNDVKSSGYYEIQFNGANLASGIYIYQLRTNDFVQTKKMNLLK